MGKRKLRCVIFGHKIKPGIKHDTCVRCGMTFKKRSVMIKPTKPWPRG